MAKFNTNTDFLDDLRVIRCTQKLGWHGYGVYMAIVQWMYKLDDWNLPLDYDFIARHLNEKEEIIKSVVCDFGLFRIVEDTKLFLAVEVKEQIKYKREISNKRRRGC